ncbi:MAG: UDP-glucose 4-epimerase GalE [Ruminococcaceae bacterium]|nr:UDP-glucose 4-epimerase GalE [Oscillospiraceae bacterium]
MSKILITGGAGYIGSHTCVELLAAGHELIVIDNLENSSPVALERVRAITGRDFAFYKKDLRDRAGLTTIFEEHSPEAVIHFAGLKAVGESVSQPLRYYRNNLDSTITLLEVMTAANCRRLVFSSSATVYGIPDKVPITEDAPLFCTNPYGWTKLMIEQILRDLFVADPTWGIMILRYFNPIGAHESGLIGEDPAGIPNNLLPFVAQVAAGRRPTLHIFGNDYPTRDGTGVRDYIHVVDLAQGHSRAIDFISEGSCLETVNLGTGHGYSVLEIVKAYEEASGLPVPYQFDPRRPGDIAECYADPAKAHELLNWSAQKNLADMCRDTARWQAQNPAGYQTEK